MQKHLVAISVGLGLATSALYLVVAKPVVAAKPEQSSAVFGSDGKMKLPDPHTFRRWVFVGAPLTPNALNNGSANCLRYVSWADEEELRREQWKKAREAEEERSRAASELSPNS